MKAVVTGASKGIGYAIAKQLASEGHDLYICSRSQAEINKVKQEMESLGVTCHAAEIDLEHEDEVRAFAQMIRDQWESLDILVNNAGVYIGGLVSEEEDGALEKMLRVNLLSGYHLTRALLPCIKAAARGYIFNMCSIASFMSYPNAGSYSISKFAQLGFSRVLRSELYNSNIAVTAIMPGATWSNSWAGVDLPDERLMKASDIAEVISAAIKMSPSAVMEEIIVRPQQGDL